MKRLLTALILALAIHTATISARADISFNPSDRLAVKAAGILNKRVPAVFLQTSKVVKLRYGFTRPVPFGVVGVYYEDGDRIELAPWRKGIDVDEDLTHEYGHFVYFKLLTEAQREEYGLVYAEAKLNHKLGTAYAYTDKVEGFAEAFSLWVCRDKKADKAENEWLAGLTKALGGKPLTDETRSAFVTPWNWWEERSGDVSPVGSGIRELGNAQEAHPTRSWKVRGIHLGWRYTRCRTHLMGSKDGSWDKYG